MAADGTLYIAGSAGRMHRLAVDGRLGVAAGTDTPGDAGDGDLATAAQVFNITGLALGADGGLFLADNATHRVRRIGPEGIMTAQAGRVVPLNPVPTFDPADERGPALAAAFGSPVRVALAPDGSLYVVDQSHLRVRRVRPPLPGFSAVGDLVIASRDGSELYVFDSRGRHLRTVDALTTTLRYEFAYDAEGRIAGVTDVDDRSLLISRPDANTVVLTGPDAQVTTLTLGSTGYVAAIATPAGTTTIGAGDTGLVASVTDPNGHPRTFTYGSDGRLAVATDPPGTNGSDTLTRSDLPVPNGSGYQVTHTTGAGVETTYQVEFLPTGEERRTILHPDGTQTVTVIDPDGSRTVTQADGTVQTSTIGPDPRFGLQAPVTTDTTLTTPAALQASITATRETDPPAPPDPLVFTSQTERVSVNGRPEAVSTYDTATRVTTDTTPAGRQTQTTLDAKGRAARVQAAGLHPLRLEYDAAGRPTMMRYGPDPDTTETRLTAVSYVSDFDVAFEDYPPAAKGQVKTTTDPAGRTTTFEYYPTGRVKAQILPGNRRVEFGYDDAGNVTAITPPGRPLHEFAYTPVNLEESYTPPQVTPPLANRITTYTYTPDRQLDLVERPDNKQIDYVYDTAGRLDGLHLLTAQQIDETHDYVYDDPGGPGEETGNLAQIITPAATLEFSYDGSLPTGEAWSGLGLATASVTKTYDPSLRLQTQQIAIGATTQSPITFQYDNDDLLTQVGALSLTPDAANGLLRGTSISTGGGTITDATDYTSFGEVEHYEARHNGNEFVDFSYTRDALGRITSITETLTLPPDPPIVTTTHYTYDAAGRLFQVCADAACATVRAEYHYDANGNRIAPTRTAQGEVSATYDAQDRLLAMTVGPTAPTTYT